MLIICKKYPLAGLLASEGTKDVTQGLIPAVADIKKNRLAITGKRSENHNDLANYLVAEEGSSLDDIYDLAITTDGKIFFAQMARFFSRVNLTTAKTYAMRSRQLSIHG